MVVDEEEEEELVVSEENGQQQSDARTEAQELQLELGRAEIPMLRCFQNDK